MRDWIKFGRVLTKSTTHLIWTTKYRRKVLLGSVKIRLEILLKTIADQNGCELLAARVHYGDHVHVFVFAAPKVYIPDLMRVFKRISAMCFSLNFLTLRQFWGGRLWSEGYAVKTAGDFTGAKIEEYINRK